MLKTKASARIKRRYLLLEGSRKEVEKVILEYVGVLGWAKADPQFVHKLKLPKGQEVLAVERKELNNIRAAFEICKEDIKVLKVSGTLKGLGVR